MIDLHIFIIFMTLAYGLGVATGWIKWGDKWHPDDYIDDTTGRQAREMKEDAAEPEEVRSEGTICDPPSDSRDRVMIAEEWLEGVAVQDHLGEYEISDAIVLLGWCTSHIRDVEQSELVLLRRIASSAYCHLDDINEANVTESELCIGRRLDDYEEFLRERGREQIGIIAPGDCYFHGKWDTEKEPYCPGCTKEGDFRQQTVSESMRDAFDDSEVLAKLADAKREMFGSDAGMLPDDMGAK